MEAKSRNSNCSVPIYAPTPPTPTTSANAIGPYHIEL